MAATSNCEMSEVHCMHLDINKAKMPCHDSKCIHEKQFYVFDNNNIKFPYEIMHFAK